MVYVGSRRTYIINSKRGGIDLTAKDEITISPGVGVFFAQGSARTVGSTVGAAGIINGMVSMANLATVPQMPLIDLNTIFQP